jgi:hypothetical protein
MAGASLRDGRSAADAEPTPKARTIALAATTYFIMIMTLTHTDSLARPVAAGARRRVFAASRLRASGAASMRKL